MELCGGNARNNDCVLYSIRLVSTLRKYSGKQKGKQVLVSRSSSQRVFMKQWDYHPLQRLDRTFHNGDGLGEITIIPSKSQFGLFVFFGSDTPSV